MNKNNMRFLIRTRGFSFIELMTTLTIATLLVTMAMPSMKRLFLQSQEEVLQDQLISLLNFARRAALLQQQTIGFCQSQDLSTCSDKSADGVIIFIENKNQPEILYTYRLKQSGQIHWRGFPQSSYLQFLASGLTAQENGSFWYRSARGVLNWRITVSKAGRAKVEAVTSTR